MSSSFEYLGVAVPATLAVCRRSLGLALVLALLASTACVESATAALHPQTRDGWFVGLGFGAGSAAVTANGASSDREMGSAISLRGGYVMTPNWALGLETNLWYKTIDGVEWTFSTYAVGITAFPAEGLVLRAGVGGGDAEAAVTQGNTTSTATESGFGVTGGAAYEFRVMRTFHVGPEISYSYVNLNSFDVNYVNFGVQFGWYFIPK